MGKNRFIEEQMGAVLRDLGAIDANLGLVCPVKNMFRPPTKDSRNHDAEVSRDCEKVKVLKKRRQVPLLKERGVTHFASRVRADAFANLPTRARWSAERQCDRKR